ncbi:hypothetical protein IFM89_036298 [Coptis chinensis]|uniref:Amidase domain-containing protein n=1 Tax=Coptis chinensis TaxID=261450 RepID=A0A835M5Q1_9MAGN|nr:hypothetical protein IFM89_036298 [Coptis chinensis]
MMNEYDENSFKIEEATIKEIQSAFQQNKLTSKQLVQYYLDAIQKLNPTLCSVIEVNSEALSQAAKADNDRILPGGCGCSCGMEGIPVLLKDNIATKDTLNTTSGSFALLNSVVPRDAGVIDRLRKAGAIILGKAGLSQWANYRGTNAPGGWSARGGTVKNPYVLTTEPGGSSTGSAVSVGANLVTVSLGTETNGSIIEPCSVSCVVGIKPTLGLTSRSGVIPISLRQDTVGPIGRTVSDAVYLLDVIVGYDPRDDEMTKEACQYIPLGGYKQFLKTDGLSGKRLGNMWHLFKVIYDDDPTSPVPAVFQRHINTMRNNGAVVVNDLELNNFLTIMKGNEEALALKYEFKRDLGVYLSNLLKSPIKSLADAIAFNIANPDKEMTNKYNQSKFIDSEETKLPCSEYTAALCELTKLSEEGFHKFMRDNSLDAMVVPEFLGASILANGGYPGIIVPAGFNEKGVPFGILFGGLKGSEPKLIEIAYAFEQATKIRKPPSIQV